MRSGKLLLDRKHLTNGKDLPYSPVMLTIDRTLVMTRAACAKFVGVSREAVRQRIQQGSLQTIEHEGTEYIVARAAAEWRRARTKQARAQLAKLGGGR